MFAEVWSVGFFSFFITPRVSPLMDIYPVMCICDVNSPLSFIFNVKSNKLYLAKARQTIDWSVLPWLHSHMLHWILNFRQWMQIKAIVNFTLNPLHPTSNRIQLHPSVTLLEALIIHLTTAWWYTIKPGTHTHKKRPWPLRQTLAHLLLFLCFI